MAQKKITDLQLVDEVTDGLNIPGDDGIQSYRATAAQMKAYILPDAAITNAKMNKSAITGQTADTEPLSSDSILTYDASADALKKSTLANVLAMIGKRNFADNASFRYFQRQVPGTLTSWQDAQYGPDRWKVLTGGGAVNVQVARVAEVIAASPSAYVCQVRQADSTARQFGLVQFLPSTRVMSLRGKKVTFAFWARTDSTEITAIRAGIAEWSSTADTMTSDPVSSWSSTPTLATNYSFVNTPADLTTSSTWTQFQITVTLGSSFNNLALMIWTPNTEAQNDDLYIAQPQLVDHWEALPWGAIELDGVDDLHRCQRFFQKSYHLDVAPGTATIEGLNFANVTDTSANQVVANSPLLPVAMFGQNPTLAYWDKAGNASKYSTYTGGAFAESNNVGSITNSQTAQQSFRWAAAPGTGVTPAIHWTLVSEL